MAKKIPNPAPQAVTMRVQAEMMVASFDRMQLAKQVYDHQDAAGRDAIDRIQALLIRQSRRVVWAGTKKDRISVEIPKDAIWNNALFMAVQLLKDLAYMDIRVADFKWPDLCMDCGKPIKTRKKARA